MCVGVCVGVCVCVWLLLPQGIVFIINSDGLP